jgi:hypothetical protein
MRLNWPHTQSVSDTPYYSDEFSGQLKQGIHEVNEKALIIKDNTATVNNISTAFIHRLLTILENTTNSSGNKGDAHKVHSISVQVHWENICAARL